MLDPRTLAELRVLAIRKGEALRKWLTWAGLSTSRPSDCLTHEQAEWIRQELERLPDIPDVEDKN